MTFINTSSSCFPERMVTLDVKSMITCLFITLVSRLLDYGDDAIFARIVYVPYA